MSGSSHGWQSFTLGHGAGDAGLIEAVCQGFALRLDGIHGIAHWVRVRAIGLRLAAATGAEPAVVELFALFHDSKRLNESRDPHHGRRAADLLRSWRASLGALAEADFERLLWACEHHTAGLTEADVTVQTCWDADRLDLGRVGIRPRPELLCTLAARQPGTIEWAYRQSRQARFTMDGEQDGQD